MKKLLLALSFLPLLLIGQVQLQNAQLSNFKVVPVVGVDGWGTPLNNSDGTVALAWYVADDVSGTVTSWMDKGSNGWHLTNSLSGKSPAVITAGLNGHNFIVFDGVDDFLKSESFTDSQPNEYVFVASLTNGANQIYFDCADGGNRQLFFQDANFDAGSSVTLAGTVYSKWIVFDLIFNGASSAGYMTNILSASGNTGANSQGGFTLGGRFGLDAGRFANLAISELIVYGGPGFVPGTNVAWRSNAFSYLTNKYALP